MTLHLTSESLTSRDAASINLAAQAVLLVGGQVLLVFSGAGEAPPKLGQMIQGSGTAPWLAEIGPDPRLRAGADLPWRARCPATTPCCSTMPE